MSLPTPSIRTAPADPNNPRIDRIVQYPPNWWRRLLGQPGKMKAITGEPTPGAELGNLLGAPRIPPRARLVADIVIPRQVRR